jgi:hypothetical protein
VRPPKAQSAVGVLKVHVSARAVARNRSLAYIGEPPSVAAGGLVLWPLLEAGGNHQRARPHTGAPMARAAAPTPADARTAGARRTPVDPSDPGRGGNPCRDDRPHGDARAVGESGWGQSSDVGPPRGFGSRSQSGCPSPLAGAIPAGGPGSEVVGDARVPRRHASVPAESRRPRDTTRRGAVSVCRRPGVLNRVSTLRR